jgi:hypothetical protein
MFVEIEAAGPAISKIESSSKNREVSINKNII